MALPMGAARVKYMPVEGPAGEARTLRAATCRRSRSSFTEGHAALLDDPWAPRPAWPQRCRTPGTAATRCLRGAAQEGRREPQASEQAGAQRFGLGWQVGVTPQHASRALACACSGPEACAAASRVPHGPHAPELSKLPMKPVRSVSRVMPWNPACRYALNAWSLFCVEPAGLMAPPGAPMTMPQRAMAADAPDTPSGLSAVMAPFVRSE